jgi:hypothetical protein
MGGDERRPLAARSFERVGQAVVDADEGVAADGDGMAREVRVNVVVRELEAG